jgi:hypothetical protein
VNTRAKLAFIWRNTEHKGWVIAIAVIFIAVISAVAANAGGGGPTSGVQACKEALVNYDTSGESTGNVADLETFISDTPACANLNQTQLGDAIDQATAAIGG